MLDAAAEKLWTIIAKGKHGQHYDVQATILTLYSGVQFVCRMEIVHILECVVGGGQR